MVREKNGLRVDLGDAGGRDAVAAELARILGSAGFRSSARSQDFLRYVVTNTLEGRLDLLKERTIGAEVFQRPADYDTGEDSIVRVKASELRKRLAQFYLESGADSEVRIDLPAGSYVPEFRRLHAEAGQPLAPAPRRRLSIYRLLAGCAVLGLALWGGFYLHGPRETALDRFWRPVLDSSRPVLLAVAHPVVYEMAGSTRDLLDRDPAARLTTIPGADVMRDPDHYVGVGDALALAQLSGFFNRQSKAVAIRMGSDMSFADLRSSPAVLIGAFSNQWTMQMTKNLRFIFDAEGRQPMIRDQMDPSRRWVHDGSNLNSDFVLLSRIFDSRSGEMLITAAGLVHAGTQMAGEFLTNPGYFENAVRGAPPDWPRRNIQLVVTGEVIGRTPGPPRVVAEWYW